MRVSKFLLPFIIITFFSCNNGPEAELNSPSTDQSAATIAGGQESVQDEESAKDVVKVAVSSKDHTTLVAALKQAELVTSLSNAGPFTVFAPTNDAFNKVPKETLDVLMTDEKKEDLQNVLQYHVTLSAIKAESLQDGQILGMVNGNNVTVSIKEGVVWLNNSAKVVASVPASNGIVHVIDGVLLPPAQ